MNETVNYSGFIDLIKRHDICETHSINRVTPLERTEVETNWDANSLAMEKTIETNSE